MSHTIKLSEEDQQIILKALLASLEDKEKNVIRDKSKLKSTEQQYTDAAEKFLKPVVCGHNGLSARDNLFGWLIDQIDHSPNIKKTELGEQAINICRAAAQNRYERYRSVTSSNFHNLFD